MIGSSHRCLTNHLPRGRQVQPHGVVGEDAVDGQQRDVDRPVSATLRSNQHLHGIQREERKRDAGEG